ncbi:MAG: sugar phosphate isomerase/epimerase [Anaerolineae bacterium]|nr:sugar phosphate isomerase/epimerase [Anaerolineae bacterium]
MTTSRVLFSTGALYLHPLRIAFEVAQSAGCDGIELDVGPEIMRHGARPAIRLVEEMGLPVRAVHPPLFRIPGWRNQRTVIPRVVELGVALEASTIVFHPPKVRRTDDPEVDEFVSLLAEARRRLQHTGTVIALENPPVFRPADHDYPFWNIPVLVQLAERCGVPIALDTAHAGASRLPLLEAYALTHGRLAHIHLSDLRPPPHWLDRPWLHSYVKHHQLVGAGELPLGHLFAALARDGFRGDVTLELSPISLGIWSLDTARRRLADAVQSTRQLLAGRADAGL